MNRAQVENTFKEGLQTLLGELNREWSPQALNIYSDIKNQIVLERTTRAYFFDRFLELLGWRLGLHGNVSEEVQVKAETTRYLDYLGLKDATNAPVLLFEAKAWGKPLITPRSGTQWKGDKRGLLVAAIQHIREDGTKQKSPVTAMWHDYLHQMNGYVHDLKNSKGHDLPCAVLSSGNWLVVFKNPTATFVDGEINDEQFEIFVENEYVENADKLFALLSKANLASDVPSSLRPSQLPDYITAGSISGVFHGLHITYESSGTELYEHRWPRILVYPALIIQRDDGVFFTAMDVSKPIEMKMESIDGTGQKSLIPHLQKVTDKAATLLGDCSTELGICLCPSDLSDFPGFPQDNQGSVGREISRKQVVKRLEKAPNEWLLATGTQTHFLMKNPAVESCRYHSWAVCRDAGYPLGIAAISTPCTSDPRSFFVDTQIYHCAHQTIQDRRDTRCYIKPIDERTCCRACVYQNLCWRPPDLVQLPCGY